MWEVLEVVSIVFLFWMCYSLYYKELNDKNRNPITFIITFGIPIFVVLYWLGLF